MKQHPKHPHISVTTFADNAPRAKYTNEQIHQVCRYVQEGYTTKDIIALTGFSKDLLGHLKAGDIWKSISKDYTFNVKKCKTKSVYTVKAICEQLQAGLSTRQIADNFHMDGKEVDRIRTGKIFKDISSQYTIPDSYYKRMTKDIAHQVCKLLSEGYKNSDIVAMGVASPSSVSKMRRRLIYKDVCKQYVW